MVWTKYDHVKRQLFSHGCLHSGIGIDRIGHIKNPRGKIHRARQQAGKWQNGRMIGRISTIVAPGIVFLSPCTFGCYIVWEGAVQTRAFNRFMYVQHDFMLGRRFNGMPVMSNPKLAVMPFFSVQKVVDITCLNRIDAVFLVEVKCFFHLRSVIRNCAARLMMPNNSYIMCSSIQRYFLKIKIRIGRRKVECIPIYMPIAVPAVIPSFNKHAVQFMFGCEVDVFLGILSSCPMLRALCP